MVGIELTSEIQDMLDLIQVIAFKNNLIKLQVKQTNGLYYTDINNLKDMSSGEQLFARANYYQTAQTNTL